MASIRVKIVGEHPWQGHTGTLTGKVTEFKHWKSPPMLEVQLDEAVDVPHGHSCYAQKQHLKMIEERS